MSLKARLGSLDDVARGLTGPLGGFRRLAFRMKLSDCHGGPPEPGRVVDDLGDGLPQDLLIQGQVRDEVFQLPVLLAELPALSHLGAPRLPNRFFQR